MVSPDAHVGPTFSCLIGQEFQRLKRGDRFWFENQGTYPNHFTTSQMIQLSKIKLSRLICDNTNTNWLPERVFELKSKLVKCENLPTLNLNSWLKSY
ncbi:TPO [Bugula neritina]|uniref:TPO n=1 Tax=Bugula neritina TaxID=10212 RepID=A0A7J7K740_BUGNE|nr:TPO [Bugula neritina]